MSNAPSPIKKAYFENLYRSIAAATETRATEAENQRKMADLKRRELDLQERSIQLGESLLAEEEKEEGKLSDDGEVDSAREQPTDREVSICGEENKSRWLLLMETGLVVEAHHLCNAECGAELLACTIVILKISRMTTNLKGSFLRRQKQLCLIVGIYWMKREYKSLTISLRMKIKGHPKSGVHMVGIVIPPHLTASKREWEDCVLVFYLK